jgi:hypothetical protein
MSFIDDVAIDLQLSNTHISIDDIKSFVERCRIWEYEWGVILADKNDMHLHILSNYRKRVFLRKPLRDVAKIIFKEYEVIKTSILKTKPKALDFDLRLGWKLVNETDEKWILEMKKEDFKYEPI